MIENKHIALRNLALSGILLLMVLLGKSQDIHFSQISTVPLYLNPAYCGNSGFMIRAGLNYKSQWSSFTTPYETQAAAVDRRINIKSWKNDWLGCGGMFYKDQAGDGSLKVTKGMLFASYGKGLNRYKTAFTTLGIGIGFGNRSVDYSSLLFEKQWNGFTFENTRDNGEPYTNSSLYRFDFNAGILFYYFTATRLELHFGASFNHINQPKETFYDYEYRYGPKTMIHGGFTFKINEEFHLKPDFLFSYQKKATETVIGINVSYQVNEAILYLGVWTRAGRDVIPSFGMYYNGFRIMASYDYTISSLTNATKSKGGVEISVTKTFQPIEQSTSKFRHKGGIPKFDCYM